MSGEEPPASLGSDTMRERAGYLIEMSFERYYDTFTNRLEPWQRIYSLPRRGVPPEECEKKYRGIDRSPLQLWYEEWRGTGIVAPQELDAALMMTELEESGRSYDGFIYSRSDADRVWSKLVYPSRWEVVWAADVAAGIPPPSDGVLLGFEPTWFCGDHFSALSDSMCFPRWHGTDEEGVLFARYHERLNRHALFDAPSEAEEFLRYYRSFDWTEDGDYVIAEVRLISR